MSENPVLELGLNLTNLIEQRRGNKILSTIIMLLSIILPGGMFLLGILEPFLNFTSMEALSDSMDIISNYFMVLN